MLRKHRDKYREEVHGTITIEIPKVDPQRKTDKIPLHDRSLSDNRDKPQNLLTPRVSIRFSDTNYVEAMPPTPESIPTLPNEDHTEYVID